MSAYSNNIAKIDYLLAKIDCALTHPTLPASGSHRRRPSQEIKDANAHLNLSCNSAIDGTTPPPLAPEAKERVIADVKALYKLLYDLYKNVEVSEPFREPINAFDYGIFNYYNVIKTPMCLRTVLERIVTGKYATGRPQILEDVALIWSNCKQFNGPENPITRQAYECEAWVESKVQEMDNNKQPEESAVNQFSDFYDFINGQLTAPLEARLDAQFNDELNAKQLNGEQLDEQQCNQLKDQISAQLQEGAFDLGVALTQFVKENFPFLLDEEGLDLEKLNMAALRGITKFVEDVAEERGIDKRPRSEDNEGVP